MKTARIEIRLTLEEKIELALKAAKAGMTITDYVILKLQLNTTPSFVNA